MRKKLINMKEFKGDAAQCFLQHEIIMIIEKIERVRKKRRIDIAREEKIYRTDESNCN